VIRLVKPKDIVNVLEDWVQNEYGKNIPMYREVGKVAGKKYDPLISPETQKERTLRSEESQNLTLALGLTERLIFS